MSGYASGKYSFGLCDYCGQKFPYLTLKKNWKGFKVCPEDYEEKEAQEQPLKHKSDPESLYEPRPDREEPLEVFLGGTGDSSFSSQGMQPSYLVKKVVATSNIGTVSVVIS